MALSRGMSKANFIASMYLCISEPMALSSGMSKIEILPKMSKNGWPNSKFRGEDAVQDVVFMNELATIKSVSRRIRCSGMDFVYQPEKHRDDDVFKITHIVRVPFEGTVECDFTPYCYMNQGDLRRWFRFGCPSRSDLGMTGPITPEILRQLDEVSANLGIDPSNWTQLMVALKLSQ